MASYEDIKQVTEIVGEVLLEDNLINKHKSKMYNAIEFTFKIMPILPYIQWDKRDNEEEFKRHVKTLFRNQLKIDRVYMEREEK